MNSERELKEIARERLTIQDKLIKFGAWQSCLNCLWWQQVTVINGSEKTVHHECHKFAAIPPPHIIVSGCEDHEADIPF